MAPMRLPPVIRAALLVRTTAWMLPEATLTAKRTKSWRERHEENHLEACFRGFRSLRECRGDALWEPYERKPRRRMRSSSWLSCFPVLVLVAECTEERRAL